MRRLFPRSLPCVLVLTLWSVPTYAQERHAIVLESAPIVLVPEQGRQPLRVAAAGSVLTYLKEENGWTQVQFQDPQFGLRTGWMQNRFVRVDGPNLQPLDLSVPEARRAAPTAQRTPATPAPIAPQPTPDPVQPTQRPPMQRQGFWFSGGMGFGSLSCDTCDGYANGFSGGLAAGGTINQHLLLGAGTTGWYRSSAGVWLNASTFDVRLRYYPVSRSGFFINGGIGVGDVSIGTGRLRVSETGAAVVLGLGWDIRTGRNISVTPFWNGSGISTGAETVSFGQIGVGITVH
jgi:Outer membrane protein beta-barrel domain